MKTTFIVTAAVNTNIGIYDPWARILQINETINSIYRRVNDAKIILVDGGKSVEDAELLNYYDTLKSRVHAFLDLTKNEHINHLHAEFLDRIPNRFEMGGTTGLTKSAAEIVLFYNTLMALKTSAELTELRSADRIFKISGRYQLAPLFDISQYNMAELADRYVFKTRTPSWMPDAKTALDVDSCYQSRLWSFPGSKLDDCIARYEKILADVLEISEKHYVDVEHLLYKHMGPDVSTEFDLLHLMGSIAPNGTLIYD